MRLFADDCLIYREIHSVVDQNILQRDLTSLQEWAERWGMKFNPKKCYIMQVNRIGNPRSRMYDLCGCVLQEVTSAVYLGVTISNDLEWEEHIKERTRIANCSSTVPGGPERRRTSV